MVFKYLVYSFQSTAGFEFVSRERITLGDKLRNVGMGFFHERNMGDISFSYEQGTKILDDVSFTIPQGGMTAIVGPSGGGKTTITRLISRFWDIQGGSITIGGKDVREFTSDSLLKNMSMVFQNVYLFKDTIENNITIA